MLSGNLEAKRMRTLVHMELGNAIQGLRPVRFIRAGRKTYLASPCCSTWFFTFERPHAGLRHQRSRTFFHFHVTWN